VTFQKTDEGRLAIQKRHIRLSACQRAVLITVNGSQTQLQLYTLAMSMGGTAADVDQLMTLGLIEPAAVDEPVATAPAELPGDEALATSAPVTPAISMESLWPQDAGINDWEPQPAPNAQQQTAAQQPAEAVVESTADWTADDAFSESEMVHAVADFGAAKAFTLQLLAPLGLRTIQLRRSVEAAQTPGQLRQLEPLVRELLSNDQRLQLDSAYFGLPDE
jgi:hypothetical protein